MDTPVSDDAIALGFPAYIEAVRKRLEAGKRSYGDASFERPLSELARELQAEALDFAGWGFILYQRALRLEELAIEASSPHRHNGSCAGFVRPPNGEAHASV